MVIERLKYKYGYLYVHEENQNGFVKAESGDLLPIKYSICYSDSFPLGLKDYMSVRQINLERASAELADIGAVLLGNHFNIAFTCKDSLEDFKSIIKNNNK